MGDDGAGTTELLPRRSRPVPKLMQRGQSRGEAGRCPVQCDRIALDVLPAHQSVMSLAVVVADGGVVPTGRPVVAAPIPVFGLGHGECSGAVDAQHGKPVEGAASSPNLVGGDSGDAVAESHTRPAICSTIHNVLRTCRRFDPR